MSARQEAVQDVHTGKQEVDLNLYHTINQSFDKYYKYGLCCLSCYYVVLTLPFPTSSSALSVSA